MRGRPLTLAVLNSTMQTPVDKTVVGRQIDGTGRQTCPDEGSIDRLVYVLCAVTDEEIAIAETATER